MAPGQRSDGPPEAARVPAVPSVLVFTFVSPDCDRAGDVSWDSESEGGVVDSDRRRNPHPDSEERATCDAEDTSSCALDDGCPSLKPLRLLTDVVSDFHVARFSFFLLSAFLVLAPPDMFHLP